MEKYRTNIFKELTAIHSYNEEEKTLMRKLE